MAQSEKFQAGYESTSVTDALLCFCCILHYSFIEVGLLKKKSSGFWSADIAGHAILPPRPMHSSGKLEFSSVLAREGRVSWSEPRIAGTALEPALRLSLSLSNGLQFEKQTFKDPCLHRLVTLCVEHAVMYYLNILYIILLLFKRRTDLSK